MGNISQNLDQAMSKKKVAEEEGGGKHKEKTHTQFFWPNWAKFYIWEEFLIKFCQNH